MVELLPLLVMRKGYEILTGVGLATSLALGATACGGSSENDHTACVGVYFASPKGGPGDIIMYAFPKFNTNFGDARKVDVYGQVITGNNIGQQLQAVPDLNEAAEYHFTWDRKSKTVQSDVVRLHASFGDGQKLYTCPDTRLQFDPSTYKVTPHLPSSPY
jgi:hypothetical protein